jgi:hypothetical protein
MKILRFLTQKLNTSVIAKNNEFSENGIHW